MTMSGNCHYVCYILNQVFKVYTTSMDSLILVRVPTIRSKLKVIHLYAIKQI